MKTKKIVNTRDSDKCPNHASSQLLFFKVD